VAGSVGTVVGEGLAIWTTRAVEGPAKVSAASEASPHVTAAMAAAPRTAQRRRRRSLRPRSSTPPSTSRSFEGKAHLLEPVAEPAPQRHQAAMQMRLHRPRRQLEDLRHLFCREPGQVEEGYRLSL